MNENSVRQIEVQESIEISNSIDSVTSSFQRKSEDYKNKGRVVQISISFFLLFVAFNTCETLITSILE
jgi:MFS family permease